MWFTSFSFVDQEFMVRVADLAQGVKKRLKTAVETCDEQTRRCMHSLVLVSLPKLQGGEAAASTIIPFRMGSNSVLFEDSKLDKLPKMLDAGRCPPLPSLPGPPLHKHFAASDARCAFCAGLRVYCPRPVR